jgi:hypothetical protein
MAIVERPRDAASPDPTSGSGIDAAAEQAGATAPAQVPDEPDYYFWGINELYVAP